MSCKASLLSRGGVPLSNPFWGYLAFMREAETDKLQMLSYSLYATFTKLGHLYRSN
jgi:hypothetical protein